MLNEIAEHFSIDRSSVFRLVATLTKNGFVLQNSETKQYSLGYRILELSGSFSNNSYIENLIRPVLKRVVSQTGQNTHLAVMDGLEVIFLAVEQPNDPLTLNISVGNREPSVVTALGRSLLAFLEPALLDELLLNAEFKAYTKKSVRSINGLQKKLKLVRKNRLAIDDEEYRQGIMCIAAPIFNHQSIGQFSIGISGLKDAIKPQTREFGSIIKAAGQEASALLGHINRKM